MISIVIGSFESPLNEADWWLSRSVEYLADLDIHEWRGLIRLGAELNASGHGHVVEKIYAHLCEPASTRKHEESYKRRQKFNTRRGSTKTRMLERGDRWACVACGQTTQITIDHIVPISLGGTDDLANLQFLCRRCNARKNNGRHGDSH